MPRIAGASCSNYSSLKAKCEVLFNNVLQQSVVDFLVGGKRKLRPAWLVGYTQPGTGHFVVRYFAFGNLNCRAAHSIVHWNQVEHLTAFKSLRRIQERFQKVENCLNRSFIERKKDSEEQHTPRDISTE